MMDLTASTLAERLRERDRQARARRLDPLRQAEILAGQLANGDVLADGEIVTSRAEIVERFVSAITKPGNRADQLFPDVLLAALRAPDRALNGRCRWCLADQFARVKMLPPLPWSKANQLLLGAPCESCATRLANAMTERSERRERRRLTARQLKMLQRLTASAADVQRDDKGRPTRVRTSRSVVASSSCADGSCSCLCRSHSPHARAGTSGDFLVDADGKITPIHSYHDAVTRGTL